MVQLLADRDTACEAANAIANMVGSAWDLAGAQSEVVSAGALPPLVALLGAESTAEVQSAAAGALRNIICGADNRVKVAAASAGAVSFLVALLGTQEPAAVQEQAAAALQHLAFNADSKSKIIAAGAIPSLVALLRCNNTAAVQEVAAGALCMLVRNADNEVKTAASVAIPLLVTLLGIQHSAAVQEAAAKALSNITGVDAGNNIMKAAAVAIPPLVALLGTHNTDVQLATAQALWNLVDDADNQVEVAAAGAISPLVALLGIHSTAAVQEVAVGVLTKLAFNADCLVAIKSDPCALSTLSELQITSASAAAKCTAELALKILDGSLPFVPWNIQSDEAGKDRTSELVAAEEEAAANTAAAVNSASLTAHTSYVAAASPSAAAFQQLPPRPRKSCWSCGATGVPLKKCSVCAVAAYCGAGCQKADWKVHKGQCAGLKAGAAGSGCSSAAGEK